MLNRLFLALFVAVQWIETNCLACWGDQLAESWLVGYVQAHLRSWNEERLEQIQLMVRVGLEIRISRWFSQVYKDLTLPKDSRVCRQNKPIVKYCANVRRSCVVKSHDWNRGTVCKLGKARKLSIVWLGQWVWSVECQVSWAWQQKSNNSV